MSNASAVLRCVGCQLTLTIVADARPPARTLGWLMTAVMRCPVCVSQLDREGVRAAPNARPWRESAGRTCGAVDDEHACWLHEGHVVDSDHESPAGHRWPVAMYKPAYEPPTIESTRVLSPVQAAIAAASTLTPAQVAERLEIGKRREPLRIAALERFNREAALRAAEPCVCSHPQGAHTPDCEQCDCDRFVSVPASPRGLRLLRVLRARRIAP